MQFILQGQHRQCVHPSLSACKWLQVIALIDPIRCLYWNNRHATLAVGQETELAFYRLDAQQVHAHRRARNRQVNMSGSTALPDTLWLRVPHGHHYWQYKLARIKAKSEAAHGEAGLAQVRPFVRVLLA